MWITAMLLIWAANAFFPTHFVLGSLTMSVTYGIIFSGLVWTVLVWFTEPVLRLFKIKPGKGMSMMMAYLAANVVALWLISRLGPVIGFGISGILWVFGLAFVANFVQYIVWIILAKLKLAEGM